MKKTLMLAPLALCLFPSAVTAQTPNPASPEAVVREFYGWYLGSLSRDDFQALKRRREALRYLTPEFHRRAPRIIAREMADIFICAQDWQAEWGKNVAFSAGPVRGARAQVTAAFKYDSQDYTRVQLTLRRVGGRWRIDGANCVE